MHRAVWWKCLVPKSHCADDVIVIQDSSHVADALDEKRGVALPLLRAVTCCFPLAMQLRRWGVERTAAFVPEALLTTRSHRLCGVVVWRFVVWWSGNL